MLQEFANVVESITLMEQSAEDFRTEQYEPPDQVQSNVLLSFSVHTPDPFLSPAPLVADDVESPLEICHFIVAPSIIFESGIFNFFKEGDFG